MTTREQELLRKTIFLIQQRKQEIWELQKQTNKRQIDGEYDYIICGAGASGCVIAARLSEDPDVSVLLLEAGPDDRDEPLVRIPGLLDKLQLSWVDWKRETVPQKHGCMAMNGRRSAWPLGKMLGGSTSHNGLQYVRSSYADYDEWVNKYGCDGWSGDEVLEYFKKSEGNCIEGLDPKYHNSSGPLKVNRCQDPHPATLAFMKASEEIGIPINNDFNGEQQLGVFLSDACIHNGERCGAADAFLRPNEHRLNLDILTEAHVTKVLVNQSKRAYGVNYVKTTEPGGSAAAVQTVKCRREVIVAGGAVHSPQILMLSGIGPKQHLEDNGIECIADLPVGSRLMDHLILPLEFACPLECRSPEKNESIESVAEWELYRKGPLKDLGLDSTSFFHSGARPDLEAEGRPDSEIHFHLNGSGLRRNPTHPNIYNYSPEFDRKNFSNWMDNQLWMVAIFIHPQSEGTIRLNSKDPFDSPLIDPNYLSHPYDVKNFVAILKKCLQIANTDTFKKVRGILKPQEKCPYEEGSDEYLEWLVRHYTMTVYHPVATCAMGAKASKASVVDPTLKVKGIEGLRVCDASIMPNLTSGNTMAPTFMIGEKASDLIKESWQTRSKL